MIIEQNSHNLTHINNLYQLLDSKEKYKGYINKITFRTVNYTASFYWDLENLNSLCDKYKNELFPILKLNISYYIVLYKEKFIKIHDDTGFEEFELNCIYSSPEEVWEKAIKPEIEFGFGIILED